jgi:hypothetical protein
VIAVVQEADPDGDDAVVERERRLATVLLLVAVEDDLANLLLQRRLLAIVIRGHRALLRELVVGVLGPVEMLTLPSPDSRPTRTAWSLNSNVVHGL